MRTDDFDYVLPPDRIAQRPAEPRDSARLLCLDRVTGAVEHRVIRDLPQILRPGDLLVVNASKVVPARLHGARTTGAVVEVLLLRPDASSPTVWSCLLKPGRRVRAGEDVVMPGGASFRFLGWADGVGRIDTKLGPASLEAYLAAHGETPFPPYIAPDESLRDRYQTVYARTPGSVAAPTAGLHFTPALLETLAEKGIRRAEVVLHVGLGTFQAVSADDPAEHVMHAEGYDVPAETSREVNAALAEGRRIVAVGTTSVRVLETAAQVLPDGTTRLREGSGETQLFLSPGAQLRIVSALLTNFHLPRTTLLMLVSTFAGREHVLAAYEEAIREEYRFYSFGDAMLIA